jgi:glycosyltransferase involved in cell wall biosynthesis
VSVSIVVATYGTVDWVALAERRAIPSAKAQGVEVIHRHGSSLAQARNEALSFVKTDFVVHLDADDELEDGYIAALAHGSADIRVPSVAYVRNGKRLAPYVPNVWGHRHDCEAACLRAGNYIVVGAMADTELVREAGGWKDFAWSEDWALWASMWKLGATVETIPEAVYRAHVRPDSRNRAPEQAFKLAVHREIEASLWPDEVAA